MKQEKIEKGFYDFGFICGQNKLMPDRFMNSLPPYIIVAYMKGYEDGFKLC